METYNAFIDYLRSYMRSEEPRANELKILLDKQLLILKTNQDKENLLNQIEKLRKAPNIDRHYIGVIQDFFNYAKFKQKDEKDVTELKKDWSGLYNDLINNYITDISLNDFYDVMNYNRLPEGKRKIKWVGKKKAEAVYFQSIFKFRMKHFNECFVFHDNTRFFENNRLRTNPEQSFIDMLTRHKNQ